jgi:hypothetical protein
MSAVCPEPNKGTPIDAWMVYDMYPGRPSSAGGRLYGRRTRMQEHDSLTVATIEARGLRLAMVCPDCGRFKYLRLHRYAADDTVGGISKKFICARCLSPAATAVLVERNTANGFWPAEQG